MVSEADFAVEQLVKDRLAAAFPTDAFLGEGTGHADFPDSTGIWVVKPDRRDPAVPQRDADLVRVRRVRPC